jgi:hypothetical protein
MAVKATWDIIVPVKLPADLKGVEPGKLPANLLRPARGEGGKPCGQLHWLAAAAWAAMCEAAEKDGISLKPVSAGDTYRTFQSQLTAFLQRYQKEPVPGASTRTFEGVKWYKKSPKLASLAAPGTSQHNLGIAMDIHTAAEPKRLNWLVANVRKFGWSWEVVPEEPWHIRYTEGDSVPAAVKEYMDRNGIVAPQPSKAEAPKAETPKPAAPKVEAPKPVAASQEEELAPGAKGDRVKLLQQKLKEKGFYKGNPDGDFGPATVEAVRKFKQASNLAAGPKVGKKAQEILGM